MYAPRRVATFTIASAAATSTVYEMGDQSYSKVAINFPAMSTSTVLQVFGCDTVGGTYAPVHERVNTAPVQYQALTIATSTSGAWAVFDCPPNPFLQFVATAAVAGGVIITAVFSQN